MIKWLIALFAGIAAVAAAVFFLSRNRREASKLWHESADTATSWGKTAAEKAEEAIDQVAEAARDATDKVAEAGDTAAGAGSDTA